MPKGVIDDARGRIEKESVSFEETIERLENQRRLLEKDREETERKLRETEENAKKAEQLRRELSVRLEMADQKAKREAQRILDDARRTAERTFDALDGIRKRQNREFDHIRENEARTELRRSLNEAEQKLSRAGSEENEERKSSRPLRVGDMVEIKAMVNRENTLGMIDDIKAQLPIELTEAKRLVSARDEFIANAKREAESIRRASEEQARRIVDEQEVTRTAKARANEIMQRPRDEQVYYLDNNVPDKAVVMNTKPDKDSLGERIINALKSVGEYFR